MTLFFWIVVFLVSLFVLVKGADWLLQSAEKIGLAIGMSPFIVGVTIVGAGTSLPELVSSAVAMFQGVSEIVSANAIGSNIANILLIVGFCAILARRLSVSKDLIDLDLPLLAISTVIFYFVANDGSITFFESVFLIITYIIYLGFSVIYKDDEADEAHEIEALKAARPKLVLNDFFMLIIGLAGLSIGSNYLIDAVVSISNIIGIGAGVIAITAVAIGTSLPELLVSAKAALRHQSEIALGNIFGSNIFNVLIVVGIPGLFGTIALDEKAFTVGLPMLMITTGLFVISGISRRIHVQEGAMYILLYIIFTAKLFNLF